MKDILGREIQVGDIILEIQTNYNWLRAGIVSRFTATNVFYFYSTDEQDPKYIGEDFCKPKYILIISKNELLRMLENETYPNKQLNFNDVIKIKQRL
jgi:hypothetical protein